MKKKKSLVSNIIVFIVPVLCVFFASYFTYIIWTNLDKKEFDTDTYNQPDNSVIEPEVNEYPDLESLLPDDDSVMPYVQVDVMPQFRGGHEALLKFIGRNLKYPQESIEKGIEGRVIVRFVVSAEGKVTDIVVMRGLDKACDAEAIRVVEAMPDWIPGMQDGKPVPVYFTLPVLYKLTK
ncbi:energy transducer TonB [Dysgonomonas sp. 216]|uniref:energy transducer TonB n=1 Tax=Dysgonomonas sp. 216 TaxID=2302934 RepID=UPI0013D8CBC5|nr:energy transducer TonB [Dysgonomonas sp. 216]